MQATQTDRAQVRAENAQRLRELHDILDTALGADNGRAKSDIAIQLFHEDTPDARYKTTQLLATYRRQQLELGRMFVSFHRDGEWLNAAIADAEEGSEIVTRDISRLQSAANGLTRRARFLQPRGLLQQVHVDALEAERRAIGTALLTPISFVQIAAPQPQP